MSHATVFVIDDDHAVRDSVGLLLETAGFKVARFASAEEFLAADATDEPACLVLDLRMTGMSGVELQRWLRERGSTLPIVFLTAHGDIPTTVRAIKEGAVDFLTKPVDPEELVASVRAALAAAATSPDRRSSARTARLLFDALTEREREVVRLALAGYSNKEIGRRLNISHRTVEFHRSRVLAKTGASSLLQLAAGRTGNGDEPAD